MNTRQNSLAELVKFDEPGALSGMLSGVSFVGGLATGLSLADAPFPRPGAEVRDIKRFFIDNAGPERLNLTGQLLSAAFLARYSLSVARLAGRASRRSGALRAAGIGWRCCARQWVLSRICRRRRGADGRSWT